MAYGRHEIKARTEVIHNTGMPKIGIYFCLRCFRASYLPFMCCLRRLQALAGFYMPISCEYSGVNWLGAGTYFIATHMAIFFKLVAEIVLITHQGFYYS